MLPLGFQFATLQAYRVRNGNPHEKDCSRLVYNLTLKWKTTALPLAIHRRTPDDRGGEKRIVFMLRRGGPTHPPPPAFARSLAAAKLQARGGDESTKKGERSV